MGRSKRRPRSGLKSSLNSKLKIALKFNEHQLASRIKRGAGFFLPAMDGNFAVHNLNK
jgi:hypothetical protein